MPIIIDVNCLANVFSDKASKHKDFIPVRDWILKDKGIILYGGEKYNKELNRAVTYRKLFRRLREVGKAQQGDASKIDKFEKQFKVLIPDPLFNDAHIAAIARSMNCRIICSEDDKSVKFVCSSKFYTSSIKRPVYYTGFANKNLLSSSYIDPSYKIVKKPNKNEARKYQEILNNFIKNQ